MTDEEPSEPDGWGEAKHLIWLDIETTGLDPGENDFLEIGLVITSSEFREQRSTAVLVKPRSDSHETCFEAHKGTTGLWEQAREHGLPLSEAIRFLDGWLSAAIGRPGAIQRCRSPLCGSSVQFDRIWLALSSETDWWLDKWFSYRDLDVSSLHEWAMRVYGADKVNAALGSLRQPDAKHRAVPDLRHSIGKMQSLTDLAVNTEAY